MQLTNKAILLYNIKTDPDTGYEVYHPTLITGVSYFTRTIVGLDKSGMLAANLHTIRVPIDADFCGKQYVAPVDYQDADPEKCFTFKVGDIIVASALVEDHDIIDGDKNRIRTPDGHYLVYEYIRGYADNRNLRPAEIQKLFGDIVTVVGVTDNRGARCAPHWKLEGK